MTKEFQDRVDMFVGQVYKWGGATAATTSVHSTEFQIAIENLPGIITKFESLDDAIARFEAWERENKK